MIHQRELEQQITDWLKDTLLDQSLLEPYFQQVLTASHRAMTEKDNRMNTLRRELGQIDGRIERLVDAIADGELPLDVIKQKIHTEEDRKRELSAELRYFQLPSPTIPDIETFRNELIEALDDPGAKKCMHA